MMKNLDREAARQYILDGLDLRAFGSLAPRLPRIIGDMIEYDLHFRRLTGTDEPGKSVEYDEDEAFEYIYDAWLGDNPGQDDEDMTVALLLDCFMDLWQEYLEGQP